MICIIIFDKNNKCINLLVKDGKIPEKYYKIWNKIKSLFKKESDNEQVYNDKYIKTKMKIYNDRVKFTIEHTVAYTIKLKNRFKTELLAFIIIRFT